MPAKAGAVVIWDMDGVLVDSMPQHAEAFRQVLGPQGIQVSDRRVFELEGMPSRDVIRRLADEAGVHAAEEDLDSWTDTKETAFQEMGRPPPVPGAEDAIRMVPTDSAIVTGSSMDQARWMLGAVAEQPVCIVASDDTEEGKPAPDPFLLAAQRLDREPADCIVVENAPLGIESARAAGCGTVLALETTLPAKDLAADAVYPSMDELLPRLAQRVSH